MSFPPRFLFRTAANYAYMTSKKYEENGFTGRIISNAIDDPSNDHCISFYYQLNGKRIQNLDVFIRTIESETFTNFWTMRGHQGNTWKRGGFTIPKQAERYEVFFFSTDIHAVNSVMKIHFLFAWFTIVKSLIFVSVWQSDFFKSGPSLQTVLPI